MLKETKRMATIPVSGVVKDYCVHMGYELVLVDKDLYYYKIPAEKVCRLRINANAWNNESLKKTLPFNKRR